jgi:hypothetical protein
LYFETFIRLYAILDAIVHTAGLDEKNISGSVIDRGGAKKGEYTRATFGKARAESRSSGNDLKP